MALLIKIVKYTFVTLQYLIYKYHFLFNIWIGCIWREGLSTRHIVIPAQMVLGLLYWSSWGLSLFFKGTFTLSAQGGEIISLLSFELIFPRWCSAGNLMVERSAHTLRQLLHYFWPAIWTTYDLNDTSFPNVKHRGSTETEGIQPKVSSVRFNHRHSPKMNIVQDCCLLSTIEMWAQLLWRAFAVFDLAVIERRGSERRQNNDSLFHSSWNGNCSDKEKCGRVMRKTGLRRRLNEIYERE